VAAEYKTFEEWLENNNVEAWNSEDFSRLAWEAATEAAEARFTSHNKQSDEIKPCTRLSDCACVRIEGACRGVTCGVYSPA